MQNRIFQISAKSMHGKKRYTNMVHLYIQLVETFALILNSKIVFKKLLWLKLSILKNTLHAFKPLLFGGNKWSHILKILLAAGLFKYV